MPINRRIVSVPPASALFKRKSGCGIVAAESKLNHGLMDSDRNAAILAEIFDDSDSEMEIENFIKKQQK